MPNSNPGVRNLWCDPSPCLSTGVGISGNVINYRGCRLTPPKPFLLFHVITFLSQSVIAPGQHPSTDPILGDSGMPGGVISVTHIDQFRCWSNDILNVIRGTLITVTQMMWYSEAITPDCIALSIHPNDGFSCGYRKARRYPFSQFLFDCRVRTTVPSALHQDGGPISIQSSGQQSPQRLSTSCHDPSHTSTKPTYHSALAHNRVDLASSNGRKALGVDGHPIMQDWQILWV